MVTGEYPPLPGGVGDYTRQLSLALQQQGLELLVLTRQAGELRCLRVTADGDQLLPEFTQRGDWRLRSLPALRALVRRIAPQWLHVQYQTGAFDLQVGVNLLPRLLRSSGIATAITYHDLLPPYLFPKAGALRDRVTYEPARQVQLVISTNPADQQQLAQVGVTSRLIPIGSNIAVQPPADYERAAWRAQLGVPVEMPLIATFGLLSYSKGTDLLLELIAEQPQRRLLLIGGAATSPADRRFAEEWQQQIAARGLRDRVIMTGHVAEDQVSAHLLAADVLVLPFRDGASFRRGSLLAALAHGCAVVTTQPQDAATAFELRDAALLCQPDSGDLQAAVTLLLADDGLRAALAQAGRALAARRSWPAIAAQHVAAYSPAE